MRKLILLFTLIFLANGAWCQKAERIQLPGSRLSILRPENVLIAKHTSTIFMDSVIEFAFVEFPLTDPDYSEIDSIMEVQTPQNVAEQFQLQFDDCIGQAIVFPVSSTRSIFQCYIHNDTYGVLAQCNFRTELKTMSSRLVAIIESMKINNDARIDWESYQSFTYDLTNPIKLVRQQYTLGMRFTPDGVVNDSLYSATNIRCLQFPPAPEVKSSMDLMMAFLPREASTYEMLDVLFDGPIMINDAVAYKFNALCKHNGIPFELLTVTFFETNSSLLFNVHIMNDQYRDEVNDFINSIQLKQDGF